jgi:hypothetical protein
MDPRLCRRHADHAEEWGERDRLAVVVDGGLTSDVPAELGAVRIRRAPIARRDLVDRDDERLSGARAAHFDRPGQRVTAVQLLVPLDERRAEVPVPARVRRLEAHGVTGIDGHDRRERG